MPSLLELVGVTHVYGERAALEDIDLRLDPKELAFLVGPSGAGKTTLLRIVNRELVPTSGEVWVGGLAAHALRPRQVAGLRRRVGVVHQDVKLLPRLTALENVAFAVQVTELGATDAEVQERAEDALEAVGIAARGDAFPDELSGGEQQRVAIARAVVTEPAVIIADEPTGNLDIRTAEGVLDLLEQFAHYGAAVLVATHNLEIVKRMQRRTMTLVAGRLVRDEPAGRVGALAWAAGT
jgi:cell division transport system ATP-binding protein